MNIFISHASQDEPVVDGLVDLLQLGCNVPANEVLCTTLKGLGIPVGTESYIDFLKTKLRDSDLVLVLFSENYQASQFSLCELGGTWALQLPLVPLVLPPLKKSEVKATLKVAQAGMIDDEGDLDDLRDIIKDKFKLEARTARWNTKRDQFLDALPEKLTAIKPPALVARNKLEEAFAQYEQARIELKEKNGALKQLNAQIKELEQLKDQELVREIAKKYSTTDEHFQALCKAVQRAFVPLHQITRETLYRDLRGQFVPLDTRDKTDEAVAAEDVKQIVVDEGRCTLNTENQKIWAAKKALDALDNFIRKIRDNQFLEQFEQDYDYLPDLTNKEFWHDHLANI